MPTFLEWTCHICGKSRPDESISVYRTDLSAEHNLPPETMGHNVRYCNDNPDCTEKAKTFRHGKEMKTTVSYVPIGRATSARDILQSVFIKQSWKPAYRLSYDETIQLIKDLQTAVDRHDFRKPI